MRGSIREVVVNKPTLFANVLTSSLAWQEAGSNQRKSNEPFGEICSRT